MDSEKLEQDGHKRKHLPVNRNTKKLSSRIDTLRGTNPGGLLITIVPAIAFLTLQWARTVPVLSF